MNTSFRFLIPTIFIALGFIISCNDDITSTGEEESGVNNNTSVPDPPSTIASTQPSSETPSTDSTSNNTENPDNNESFNLDGIDPEDLSKKIKEAEEKIEKLELENTKHYDEYYQMVEVQKEILEEIKRKKMIMRSKPVGSEEQVQAQKAFEDEKKYGKEKLKVLKDKNILLNKLSRTITEARNEKEDLEKKQEYFFKKQKENKN
ncbi:hypothetical protein [Blattabacterium cuenoti]|uniref:hypothetical protein n=1 Tax=Blattabacterium cuenoti TaxID=1653831 RepID=UPI00163B7518|nr:hypothetical protein [Blattabacterium cuenoti]